MHDRVMVKIEGSQRESEGGIFIPQSARRFSRRGEVVAVGPGAYDDDGNFHPTEVKPGDRVTYLARSGQDYAIGNGTYRILREEDIGAVI